MGGLAGGVVLILGAGAVLGVYALVVRLPGACWRGGGSTSELSDLGHDVVGGPGHLDVESVFGKKRQEAEGPLHGDQSHRFAARSATAPRLGILIEQSGVRTTPGGIPGGPMSIGMALVGGLSHIESIRAVGYVPLRQSASWKCV